MAGSKPRRGIANKAGLTDPDQQEKGRLVGAGGNNWHLSVLPCPTVTVNEHVQKYQPEKYMVIKGPNSQE